VLPRDVVRYPRKLRRLAVRERTEKNRIHKRKDRRVRADSKGKRQYRNGSEARRLSQHPQSVSHVLYKGFEEADASGIAALLFDLLEAAERQAGASGGFIQRQACGYVLLYFVVEMSAELIIKFCFDGVSVEQCAEAEEKIAEHEAFP
jgi:hypothetical protein